jgi:hypothetical protein
MLPLVHVFAELGLKLDPGTLNSQIGPGLHRTPKGSRIRSASHMHDVPLFVISHPLKYQLYHAMEEAVELGIQGNKEDWGEDWVDIKFDEWYDEKIETHLESKEKYLSLEAKRTRRFLKKIGARSSSMESLLRRSKRISNVRKGAMSSEQG